MKTIVLAEYPYSIVFLEFFLTGNLSSSPCMLTCLIASKQAAIALFT